MNTKITFEIDPNQISTYNDQHLADLWHIAQANPAPMENQDAGDLVEHIGREIISRWLKSTPPNLWNHQGRHYYWNILQKHGKWLPVNGDENNRQWTPNPVGGEK